MNFKKCTESVNHGKITVDECGRCFRIKNVKGKPLNVAKIRVDKCLVDDHRERCDYLFEFTSSCDVALYLELKGADIDKAVSQLVKTMGYLKGRHKNHRKICHIVASRVPKAGPRVQNLKLTFVKKYAALLHVGTQEVEICLTKAPYC